MARLFHVSDVHFGREDQAAVRWFGDLVRREKPDAVVCTGDLTMRARSAEFSAAQKWLAGFGVPTTVEPGNHDLPYFNWFARLTNPYRAYAGVEAAIEKPLALPGVLIVPLKTTARFQLRNLSHGRVSRSGLPRAIELLKQKAPGTIAIVACHHPLIRTNFTGHGETRGGAEALAALAAAGADAVVSGHVHDPFDVDQHLAGRSVRLIGAGTLSERVRTTRPSFNELVVERGKLEVRLREMPA